MKIRNFKKGITPLLCALTVFNFCLFEAKAITNIEIPFSEPYIDDNCGYIVFDRLDGFNPTIYYWVVEPNDVIVDVNGSGNQDVVITYSGYVEIVVTGNNTTSNLELIFKYPQGANVSIYGISFTTGQKTLLNTYTIEYSTNTSNTLIWSRTISYAKGCYYDGKVQNISITDSLDTGYSVSFSSIDNSIINIESSVAKIVSSLNIDNNESIQNIDKTEFNNYEEAEKEISVHGNYVNNYINNLSKTDNTTLISGFNAIPFINTVVENVMDNVPGIESVITISLLFGIFAFILNRR